MSFSNSHCNIRNDIFAICCVILKFDKTHANNSVFSHFCIIIKKNVLCLYAHSFQSYKYNHVIKEINKKKQKRKKINQKKKARKKEIW